MLSFLKRLFSSNPKQETVREQETVRDIIETRFEKQKRSRRRSPGIPHKYKGRIKGRKRHRVFYFMDAKTVKLAQF